VIGGGASGFFCSNTCQLVRVREVILYRKNRRSFYPKVKVSGGADAMSASAIWSYPSWLRIIQDGEKFFSRKVFPKFNSKAIPIDLFESRGS